MMESGAPTSDSRKSGSAEFIHTRSRTEDRPMVALTMVLALGSGPDAPTMRPAVRVGYPRCPVAVGMTESEVQEVLGQYMGGGFSHPGKNWLYMTYHPVTTVPDFDVQRV